MMPRFCFTGSFEHFKPRWKQSAAQRDSFCPCVSFSTRTGCSVSSPQSRSLFPYSFCPCSSICCGRQSSTGRLVCAPAFRWLFCTLHLLLFLSVCLNVQRNCLLVCLMFKKRWRPECWNLALRSVSSFRVFRWCSIIFLFSVYENPPY